MQSKTTGRKNQMAKVTNLGWAKQDDPIYSSGPMLNFRPPSPESTDATATNTDGAQPAGKSAQQQKRAQPPTTSGSAQDDPMQPAIDQIERALRAKVLQVMAEEQAQKASK